MTNYKNGWKRQEFIGIQETKECSFFSVLSVLSTLNSPTLSFYCCPNRSTKMAIRRYPSSSKKPYPMVSNPALKEIGVLQKTDKSPCLISGVMHQGEEEMKKFLSKKTLRWLHDEVFNHAFTKEQQKLTIQ